MSCKHEDVICARCGVGRSEEVRAALAGSREGSPQTLRKLDAPVEYVPSLQRMTDDVRRRALAERVREACARQMEGPEPTMTDKANADYVRALDLDALLEEP